MYNSQRPMFHTQKPAFHVVEPFDNVTIVQLNVPMARLLRNFINEVSEVEEEIVTLNAMLAESISATEIHRQQEAAKKRRTCQFTESKFQVIEPFDDVTIIQLNPSMVQLLRNFIDEVSDVEVEIVALSKALADPVKAAEIRHRNQEFRRQQEAVKKHRIRRPIESEIA